MGETCSTHWQCKFFSLRFKNYLMVYVVHCNRNEVFGLEMWFYSRGG
jgi:hypothetical protein